MYTMKKGFGMTVLPEREMIAYPDPTAPVPMAPGNEFFIAGTVSPVRSVDEHRSNVVMANDPEATEPRRVTRLGVEVPTEIEVIRPAHTLAPRRDLAAPTVLTLSSTDIQKDLPPGAVIKPPERRAKTLEEEMGFTPVRQEPGMATIPIAKTDFVDSGESSGMNWRSFTWGVAVGAGGTALLGGIVALIYSAVKRS